MSLFGSKECPKCLLYEKEVDRLKTQIKRLQEALKGLKQQYDVLLSNDKEGEPLSSTDVDSLFQTIKTSQHDKEMKRYLRALLMLIKSDYNPHLHNFLKTKLQTQ